MTDSIKYTLDERDIPSHWYNIVADLPSPPPVVLHPGTQQPIGPDDLAPIFPRAVIEQEVSQERDIEIPGPVRDVYRQWRPTPLYRARRLEQALDTPARIYYKYEGTSPAGSHKPNTAIPQAFYNREEGVRHIATETGAGQWGSALAIAGAFFGVEVEVFMVKVSFQQKPYRRTFMESFGASCIASPSELTESGRAILREHPDSSGSLGIAISEAVEVAATHDDVKYSLGSVLNHVILHQSIIGEEALLQLAQADDYPDVVIGCAGGGSNMAGLILPFVRENLTKGLKTRFLAAEPTACPSMTRGVYAYDYGDSVGMGPIAKMYTLGHDFIPPGIHAGGLRYHGMAPIMSLLHEEGILEAQAYHQNGIFEAAVLFAKQEGIMPAPESAHAIRAAINEALEAKELGEERVILFNLSGHGHFDMLSYDKYLAGGLEDYEYPAEAVADSQTRMPVVDEAAFAVGD
jgi:tryptophan synthase beta chain